MLGAACHVPAMTIAPAAPPEGSGAGKGFVLEAIIGLRICPSSCPSTTIPSSSLPTWLLAAGCMFPSELGPPAGHRHPSLPVLVYEIHPPEIPGLPKTFVEPGPASATLECHRAMRGGAASHRLNYARGHVGPNVQVVVRCFTSPANSLVSEWLPKRWPATDIA